MKSIFSSKTFWLAIFQGVAGVLIVLADQGIGWALVAKSLIDIVLRGATTTPVKLI